MNEFLSAIPFAFLYALATGPVFFIVIQMALEGRGKEAFILDIGCVIADIVILFLGYLGLRSFMTDFTQRTDIFLLGGFLFICFGLYFFIKKRTPKKPQPIEVKTVLKSLIKGFLLNIFNIGGISYWLTLLVLFSQKATQDTRAYIIFFGTILVFYLGISLAKIRLATNVQGFMIPSRLAFLDKIVGFVLIVFGLFIGCKPFL